jgi:protein SCO1
MSAAIPGVENPMNRTAILALLIPIALAVPISAGDEAQPAPDVGIDQRLDQQIPLDLVFRNEEGKSVKLGDYLGAKPVILNLVYYRCPRLCSVVLNHLTESLRRIDYRIGKEFQVVTVSFDPRETPELAAAKKAAYLQSYGHADAERGWHFLTGEEPEIKRLAEAVGFRYAYDPARDQFAHVSAVMILTPQGKIARYHFGVEYPPRDVQYSLEDASAGKIGSPIARPLRMLCFSYDPSTGRYSFAILRMLQIVGLLTVVGMAAAFWRLRRKEHHASAAT